MSVMLEMPSPELAERLRREVGANERLIGMKMSVMGGSNPVPLYTFASAASFLKIGTYEEAMRPNNQATIGYIDLGALEMWVRGVFGDEELADAIKAERETGDAFGVVAPRVRDLLLTRAVQVAPAKETAENGPSESVSAESNTADAS
jgi:hypothetical protein